MYITLHNNSSYSLYYFLSHPKWTFTYTAIFNLTLESVPINFPSLSKQRQAFMHIVHIPKTSLKSLFYWRAHHVWSQKLCGIFSVRTAGSALILWVLWNGICVCSCVFGLTACCHLVRHQVGSGWVCPHLHYFLLL